MDFRILGPLDVRDGDQAVELAVGRQRALLALLIVNANETVSTDRIVEELWGEESPPTAPKVIQNHVSQLKRGLGDGLLVTDGAGYSLRLKPGSLDVDRFEELLAGGRSALGRGDAEGAADLLRKALALWRGTPAGRRRLRAVRPGRDRPSRRAAARGARGANRGRSRRGGTTTSSASSRR